jgi:hypothetical protein
MTHENKEKESKVKQTNRESWLNSMAQELKKRVFAKAGLKLDLNTIKISVGYPPKGGASKVGKAIGVCFPKAASDANVNEIFINPCLDKSQVTKVAGVLVHELIHAIDDCRNGHGPVFRKMAIACGLEGKMTATTESAKLKEIINNITKKIGPYPHKKLNYEIGRKKQTTRNLKIECPKCWQTGDPYFVRMSRTMFEKAAPKCGVCGTKMVDDVITALIDDIKAVSTPDVDIKTDFTLLEQAMIFETIRICSEYCGQWMSGLEDENLTWFIGEEMMERFNWSREKVGGVMASLEKKGAIELHKGAGEKGTKFQDLWALNCYSYNTKEVDSLIEQWEKLFPEYCDNPYI